MLRSDGVPRGAGRLRRCAHLLSVVLLLLSVRSAWAKSSSSSAPPPWTLAFQISDLHFCAWGDEPWYASAFGDREGDAQLLADASSGLVRSLAPDVVLVTGDLTDGKQLSGTGTQQPSEWASYARFLNSLADALPGVPLLDVRGNHDSFDVPYRGAPSDGYAGSTGAIFPSTRVPIGALSEARAGRAVALGEPQCRATLQRVAATALPFAPAARRGWKRAKVADPVAVAAANAAAKNGCPSVVLLGVDVAPEPGLRSPANFAGRSNASLLAEVRDALDRVRPGDVCPTTPVLAYGHYPLSTVARHEVGELDPLVAARVGDADRAAAGSPKGGADSAAAAVPSWTSELVRLAGSPLAALSAPWRGGARMVRAALTSWRSEDGLLTELAAGGSDLYVSGHLHAAFGESLHAVHQVDLANVSKNDSAATNASIAETLGASASARSSPHRLVELETTSWKEDRRVRWIVSDAASGAVSFVDAHFVPAPDASGSVPGADPPFPAAGVPLSRRVARRADALANDKAWTAARELRGWGLAPATSPPGVWASEARNLEHAARHVHATLAVIHPPDARYATKLGVSAASSARGAVRVASWTLPQAPAGTAETVLLDAYWYPSGEPAVKGLSTSIGAVAATKGGASFQRLHEAVLRVSRAERDARKAGGLALRVRAMHRGPDAGAVEDAATAPVLVALECDDADCYASAPAAASNAAEAATDGVFAPALGTTPLERFTLFVNWSVFAQRLFYLIWLAVVFILLVAPKVALTVSRRRVGTDRLAGSEAPEMADISAISGAMAATPGAESGASASARPSARARADGPRRSCALRSCGVLTAALFPWRAAVAYAALPLRWALTLAWWAGLLLGPWTLGAVMTGAPWALVFHVGEVGVLPGPSTRLADAPPGTPTPAFLLRFVPTQDTLFLALIELCFAHAPFLVWVQWTVAFRRQGVLGPRWADCDARAGPVAGAREGGSWDEDQRPLLATPSGRDLSAATSGGAETCSSSRAPCRLAALRQRLRSALPRSLGASVASLRSSPHRLLGVAALTLGYLAIVLANYLAMYRRMTPFLGKAMYLSPGIVGAPFLALAFALLGPVVRGQAKQGAGPQAAPRPQVASGSCPVQANALPRSQDKAD